MAKSKSSKTLADLNSRAKARADEIWAELAQHVRSLPPFVPGSISDAEQHHMRILRGLDDDYLEYVFDIAERALALTLARHEFLDGDEQAARPSPLRLVVDNDDRA
jgi:hypothetical protein